MDIMNENNNPVKVQNISCDRLANVSYFSVPGRFYDQTRFFDLHRTFFQADEL